VFCKEKKSKCPKKKGKFSKCEEGEKCLSIEFRVFGKKKKSSESKIFGNFAKFVLTG
jgi:hypothetical protein